MSQPSTRILFGIAIVGAALACAVERLGIARGERRSGRGRAAGPPVP
ncbi:MAG: hypothetical protein JNK49_06665 [Planctomycetes bacterium]|nr:hypothetical protein [Planctomycetota bacterium]